MQKRRWQYKGEEKFIPVRGDVGVHAGMYVCLYICVYYPAYQAQGDGYIYAVLQFCHASNALALHYVKVN